MGKPTGFLEYRRRDVGHRPTLERIRDFNEIELPLTPDDIKKQAARCMDCGIPFCHGCGCPLGNRIPEFNDMVYNDRWEKACAILHATNNFPEITGRVCPALCEASCTLGINDEPVLIRHIELQVVERGWREGWIKPMAPARKTGRNIAIVGSGPAGLAAAQQLARAGHSVVVFEKDVLPGGLLRFGIPDFKLNKQIIDRRLEQMRAEGVEFQCGVVVGSDISARYLRRQFDAICLTMGAGTPRDLPVDGRELEGIHFAMDFLAGQNAANSVVKSDWPRISAKSKNVVVIGGGDTGSDCVGTAIRQNAKSVRQFEILPKPPEQRPDVTPWPMWPKIMRTSSSHEEGCERQWSVMTKEFVGDGKVSELLCAEVNWSKDENGKWKMSEKKPSEFTVEADLVLLAMGFVHVEQGGLVNDLGLDLDERGNIITDNYATSRKGVFAAGDTVSGASLVVHALDSGRKAAKAIDGWLRE